MDLAVTIISGLSLGIGAFLLISGSVGLLRFPDFYTRMHAAGVTDTLAASLTILGMMLLSGWDMALIKLALILVFILFTSPTASHALAKAAQHGGLEPETSPGDNKQSPQS